MAKSKRPARVIVTTTAGKQVTRSVDEPLGSAANPVPDAQLHEKFHALADPVIGTERAKRVARDIWALEGMASVRGFAESLAG